MDQPFEILFARLHQELVLMAAGLERLDLLLANMGDDSGQKGNPLQTIDLLRQEAKGLCEFTAQIQLMQARGETLDLTKASAELTLAQQKARLRGLAGANITPPPDLW